MKNLLALCSLLILVCCDSKQKEKKPDLPKIVLTVDTVRDHPFNNSFSEVTAISKDTSALFYSAFYTQFEKPDFSIMKFNDIAFFYDVGDGNKVKTIAQVKNVKYSKHKMNYTCDGIMISLEDEEVCEFKDGKHVRCGKIVWDDKLNPTH